MAEPEQLTGTVNRARKRKKIPAHHAAALFAGGITFVANVTAITGLITSHANEIVMTASMVAILCGIYLLLRRWGQPVGWHTLLSIAIIVAGSVMLTIAIQNQRNADTNNPSQGTTSGQRQDTAEQSDGKPVEKRSSHSVVFEKSFEIGSNQGLELDNEKGTILYHQSQAKAPSDLYLDDSPYLYVTVKNFFPYQPAEITGDTDKDQYNACRGMVDTSEEGYNNMWPSSVIPGENYCLTTTQGRIALLTVQEMIDAPDPADNKMTFTIKLWN